MNISEIRKVADNLGKQISLHSFPVGIKFVFSDDLSIPEKAIRLVSHRYCQALMKARRGKHVILDSEGISCPAAAAAFGFKPLPEGLKNGQGLVGFGITKETGTGIEMFRGMSVLEHGKLKEIYLFPLNDAIIEPDIVVVEDEIEKLMWIALAYLNAKGGKRIVSSTAILQATCMDATLIPYLERKMNLSYGCYGCRDATDIGAEETILGFPYQDFDQVAEYIEYLASKAIKNSRGKNALMLLKKKEAERISHDDIFQKKSKEVYYENHNHWR
jgi:uncharacterized protein (DUF169 family)